MTVHCTVGQFLLLLVFYDYVGELKDLNWVIANLVKRVRVRVRTSKRVKIVFVFI
jgi:hypothetical protein